MQVEKRIVPFRSRSPSQPVSISVPITGIIPTSTIPCMGTATPSTTTAAACGRPLCLGSITVRGTFWWHNLAVFPMAGCLAGWRGYEQPALLTLVVACLGHGCPSLLPHWSLFPPLVLDPYIHCFLWTCAGPYWSSLLRSKNLALISSFPIYQFQQLTCMCS